MQAFYSAVPQISILNIDEDFQYFRHAVNFDLSHLLKEAM